MTDKNENPDTSLLNDQKEKETSESIENGKKIMDIEKKVGEKSEDELKKDAENWRNEG